jgi:hypothetical protein
LRSYAHPPHLFKMNLLALLCGSAAGVRPTGVMVMPLAVWQAKHSRWGLLPCRN